MPLTIRQLDDEPIVIIKVTGTMDGETGMAIQRQLADLTAGMPGPIYRISDLSEMETSFSDMVVGMNEALRRHPGAGSYRDPRFRSVIVTGGNDLAAMFGQGAAQTQYGGLAVKVIAMLDEALDYVRGELAG